MAMAGDFSETGEPTPTSDTGEPAPRPDISVHTPSEQTAPAALPANPVPAGPVTAGPAPANSASPGTASSGPASPSRPLRSGLIAWAQREAGIEMAAGAPAIRMALVDRLEHDQWLPSRPRQYAFETLLTGPERLEQMSLEPSAGEYYLAAERDLDAEIDVFAREFFQLEPEARVRSWRNLVRKSADFPSPTLRLRRLEAGLETVAPPVDAEPVLRSLAGHLMEIFTLPPHERAAKRRQPPERFSQSVARLPAAAARLRHQFPKLAALEPEWIDRLTKIKQLATRGYASPSVQPHERAPEVSALALHETEAEDLRRRRLRRIRVVAQVIGFSAIALIVAARIITILGLWPADDPSQNVPPRTGAAGGTPSGSSNRPAVGDGPRRPNDPIAWPSGTGPFQ